MCPYNPFRNFASRLASLLRSTAACELTKIAIRNFPFQVVRSPSHLLVTYLFYRKKKSGSYCWQLTLPSESAKIAFAILPSARILTFPPFSNLSFLPQKKSLAATYFPTAKGSIISVRELDFRVRDGNGYCLSTMATRHFAE